MAEDRIGNYRLFDEIGRGGMGILYKAEQTNLGRFVALKVVHPYLTGDPVVMKRFNHEARAAALLNHPNIVQIYDVGVDEDQHFIAMEFVPGRTLAGVLENKGRLSPEETLRIADQVAAALGAAHDVGIIHRDVKPSNILIDDHGRVKVTDFGIAVAAGQGDLTDEGHLVGTAKYMSPEHARGEELDGRTDLYALGIVMYEMLTGAPPFDPDEETGPLAVLESHVNDPVPPLEGVPPATAALVMRCLEKRRVDRPRTALEFRKLLREAACEIDWQGPALVPLEAAGADEYEHDPSFRFDHAGVVRSLTDTVAYPLAGRLHGAPGARGRIGRRLVGWLTARVRHARDSCKAKRLEVMELRVTLARAEEQLEQAKRDCDRAHEKYETADAELHEWQMSGSLVVERSKHLSRESAAVQEKKLWQQLTSYKLQWQNLQDRVRDWYSNVDRTRRDFEASSRELELLEARRRRVSRVSGATLRNRLRFALTVAVLALAAMGVVFHKTLFPGTAAGRPAGGPGDRIVDTQSMTCPRDEHAAALLDAEHVLVAGGVDSSYQALATSELFSLKSLEFKAMSPLVRARFNHTLTALEDGRVLVIGGQQKYREGGALASVELFHLGRFAEVGMLRVPRARHCATRLASGLVLVTGGQDEHAQPRADAELYNPVTNTSTLVAMHNARRDHAAALLPDGRVVVVGGDRGKDEPLSSVEVYDPATDRFYEVCSLVQARYDLTATPLDNRRVLVIGGRTGTAGSAALDSIEMVDLQQKKSTVIAKLRLPRRCHSATVLEGRGASAVGPVSDNGTAPVVLIVGGAVGEPGQRNICEIYSPVWTETRTEAPLQLTTDRNNHTATPFPDGSILFAGGWGQNTHQPLATAELYLRPGRIPPK